MAPQADTTNAKQQIVARIQQATNILVAVGNNPSIDSLSAALAMALVINKLDKHATAVFSGQVPAVMEFLHPEKTFENNVDGLRDFIISLDKEKADRLRYKLEGNVVRIYITPYRTTITQNDLQFSQGDFNVDLVIALGVEKREELDAAIVAHGRILHDAAIVTINSNNQQSSLGAVDWNDPNSSSLCEMLVALTEALQKPGLLDAQIANALLTGIVAATDRFSNQHTTPKVMTMAAQLMAAGADQQLVAVNMQKTEDIAKVATDKPKGKDATDEPEAVVGTNGQLSIKHSEAEKEKAAAKAEAELDAALPKPTADMPAADTSLDDLKAELEQAAKQKEPATEPPKPGSDHKLMEGVAPETPKPPEPKADEAGVKEEDKPESTSNSWRGHRIEPLDSAGTVTPTPGEEPKTSAQVEAENRNSQILSHNDAATAEDNQAPTVTPVADDKAAVDDAMKAVNSVLDSQEFDPAGKPRSDLGAQPMAADETAQPYIPLDQNQQSGTSVAQPEPPKDINGVPIIPPMPPLPIEDPSAPGLPPLPPPLPPLPADQQPPDVPPPAATTEPPALDQPPTPNDPGQFKIPGQ